MAGLGVQEAMSRDVVTVLETTTVGAAVDHVLRRGHTHVVVVDGTGRLVDIISAHLLTAALMTRLVHRHQLLAEILAEPTTVGHHADLAEAAALMMARSVDVLGVVDGAGELVGVLTWSDIGRCAAASAEERAERREPR